MSGRQPKTARIKLNREEYKRLRQCVFDRDGWRCQVCGSSQNLHIHHLRFRSHQGDDNEQNLITVCANCHSSAHVRVS
jgi:5-methylcytosine-specific restriction endonuclease McrA